MKGLGPKNAGSTCEGTSRCFLYGYDNDSLILILNKGEGRSLFKRDLSHVLVLWMLSV